MTAGVPWSEVDACAGTGVRNSQPEGIGRVAVVGDLLCWNNLGRNVVFADLEGLPRAVFGTTSFPGQDEPSQYDLDVHAIVDLPELGLVGVLNHFGLLRGFRRAEIYRSAGERLIEPAYQWRFAADVERAISLSGRLAGSAPRSEGGVGVLVSAPLDGVPEGGELDANLSALSFGEVTAVGAVPSPDGPLVGVGGDGKVGLYPLEGDRLGAPKWVAHLGFRVAALVYGNGAVWAAGPDRAVVDDYDWEQLRGGGFAALGPVEGRVIASGQLPDGIAWGTGGVAVAPFGRLLVAVGRTGRLHLVGPQGERKVCRSAPVAGTSLGIAHLAVAAGRVVCGFNRGGYRLFSFVVGN